MRPLFTPLLLLALATPALVVDGVFEINNARAEAGGVTSGDAPGYLVTIDQPGSYRLTGDLYVSGTNLTVVQITAEHVTLDLNGFSIRCDYLFTPCAGNGVGVGIDGASARNVAVRNGTVRDMGSLGIRLGMDAVVEDVRVLDNGGTGLQLGQRGHVRGCTATSNGGTGIETSFYGIVTGSTAVDNALAGIQVDNAGVIQNNVSVGNGGHGISGSSAVIERNQVRGNSGIGILGINGASVIGNSLHLNAGGGIFVTNSAYANNVLTSNGDVNTDLDEVIGGVAMGINVCDGSTACP